ncbi:MAG: ATP-binding cassette domain-containing protein [Betaproteobacteria bacterium]|nr:ATP-binding cassette domain-containing protein [Betaproteobacteria bacterium]
MKAADGTSATAAIRADPGLRTLLVLWSFAAPYRARIVVAAIALVVAAACFLVIGQGLRQVVDSGFTHGDETALNRALLSLLGIILLLSASVYLRFYNVSWLGERVVADLRKEVFSRLLAHSPAFFEEARTGELISRLTTDTALLEQVVGTSLSMAVRHVLLGIGSAVMLALTSLKLTGLVLLVVPLVVVPIVLFGRNVRRLSRASQDRIADLGVFLDETLHEIRTVQAYTHESVDRGTFGERVEDSFRTARRRIRVRATLVAAVIVLVFTAVGIVLWIGGHDVLSGRITAGELSAFVFYAAMMASAVGAISEVVGDLQRGAGAAGRVIELLQAPSMVTTPPNPVRLEHLVRGDVSFENVSFFYPSRPETPALDGFSLRVRAAERVALVGPSGAGKSTVFQLLLRFYDPVSGQVRVDSTDIRTLDVHRLRSCIALVSQEPAIFAANVRENVRYGRPDASDDDVEAACRAAHATEFVERLPQRYDTFLGERGIRLSGGQRQRLAIARAILADRPILLLDEATSALDAESERMVQLALESLMQGRTVLVIAHRLATVRHADRIVVIDGGRRVGEGTHESLLETNALYARLASLQFGGGTG